MHEIDFTKIADPGDFTPIPEGRYRCLLAEIDERETRNGDVMWRLRFDVMDGDHATRRVWDNLVLSQNAMPRAKLICKSLGIDTARKVTLTPALLVGRTCLLDVTIEEYTDGEGVAKKRNVVPYAGYHEDVPF